MHAKEVPIPESQVCCTGEQAVLMEVSEESFSNSSSATDSSSNEVVKEGGEVAVCVKREESTSAKLRSLNKKNSSKLNLSKSNLDEIPAKVFELTGLVELNLSNNNLTVIPPAIEKLYNLKMLDLSGNKLTTLPSELGYLKNLQDLRISFNPLPRDVKVDHFNGILLQRLKAPRNVERRNSFRIGRKLSLGTLGRSSGSKNKLARSASTSSFSFAIKPLKKLSKETKDKKKAWKKLFKQLEVGDELKYRGPYWDSQHGFLHPKYAALPKEPWESSRTYRGLYGSHMHCAIRPVTVKNEERAEFYEKIKAASEISHANVNTMLGVVKYKRKHQLNKGLEGIVAGNNSLLVVTELMLQGSLFQWIHSNYSEGVPLKKRLKICKGVAQGLQCLHSSQPMIIHHNLKSSNILFSDKWQPKVSDYFLGNRLWKDYKPNGMDAPVVSFKQESEPPNFTRPDSPWREPHRNQRTTVYDISPISRKEEVVEEYEIVPRDPKNTFLCPYWVAPELLKDEQYTEKVDVYAFAFVVFEVLTKQIPWPQIQNMDELIDTVCRDEKRPKLPGDIPQSLVDLMNLCWAPDPLKRPNFVHIVNAFDDIEVDCIIGDEMARKFWKKQLRGNDAVEWPQFQVEFYNFFGKKTPSGRESANLTKSFHDTVVDADEVVTIESFGKFSHWFGPLDSINVLDTVHQFHSEPWFHGHLSSVQSEELLIEKARGTFLLRFSATNIGGFAISVLNEDQVVKHYKVFHPMGEGFTIGTEQFPSLKDLVEHKKDLLFLRFPCPKGERYSDSNFWVMQTTDLEENKTVVSLKKLCFRFIYRNNQLFPKMQSVVTQDILEDYHATIIDSITSDEDGRKLWKHFFISKINNETVCWKEFVQAVYMYLNLDVEKEGKLKYKALRAIVKDISDNGTDDVNIESFSKMLEWFGPFGKNFLDRVLDTVSRSWFHGNLSHTQAEKIIQKNASAKKGTFLIRFSSKNRGYFTITVVGLKRSTLHYRVYYNRLMQEFAMGKRTFLSLDQIIGTYHRELSLRAACPGSKYSSLQPVESCNLDPNYLSD